MAEQIEITPDEAEIRLDRWFKRHYPHATHGQVEKLLRTGQVRVDGKRAKANARLAPGQKIRVPPMLAGGEDKAASAARTDASTLKQLKQWVLFEDADVLILNKPPGLAVQGGTGQKRHLDAMLDAWRDKDGNRPKLVHRLDRDTSGILVLGKTAFAAAKLAASFRARDTRKIYWAVTIGTPRPIKGRIDLALKKQGEKMISAEDGDAEAKDAATLYAIIDHAGKQAALVALWPLTGRTHQLRVHMQAIGTPILGDPVYLPAERTDGSAAMNLPEGELYDGLHLHARRLMMPHPRGGMIDAIAPVPPVMKKSFRWFNFTGDYPDPFDGDDHGPPKRKEK
ncbi:MAG: RluA family pseudouridine synthase [Alphaproteobacteria bacterium]